MAEIIQNNDKEKREQTWTRAGLFVFVGILAISFFLLAQEIFLIPPLFPLSIPIYLFGWLPVLIFWVLFTPAQKRILLLINPGILFVILASVILGESFYNPLFASVALDSCASFTATDKRQYVCYVPYAVYTKPLHFFEGPTYAPFMTVSDHKTVNGLDLGGAFFYGYGADLQGINFSGVRLVEAEFNGADLRGTNFSGADLRNAQMEGVDLSGANVIGADLRGADLIRANLLDLEMDESTKIDNNWRLIWQVVNGRPLTGTLSGADLSLVRLTGIDLSGMNLTGITLRYADLENVNLAGSNLTNADLYYADLVNIDLKETNLNGADLSKANMNDVNLGGADLTQANLDNANLSGADLSQATLFDVYALLANFTNANLLQVNLADAFLFGANLSEADLSAANLSGVELSNADLRGANLGRADLTGAVLWKADLRGVNFESAVLVATDLTGAIVDLEALEAAAILSEVILPDGRVYTR